jgi:predicted transcriptional regulator
MTGGPGRSRATTHGVEFRKARFSQAPTHVVVYASSPMKRILGFFEVDEMDVDDPEVLWERHGDVGCIDQAGFRDYYGRRDRGVALGVGRVTALDRPLELAALGVGARPPQSFMYLDESVLALFASSGQP